MLLLFLDKVAPFKALAGGVEFRSEIPKSPAGKILRKNLRAEVSKNWTAEESQILWINLIMNLARFEQTWHTIGCLAVSHWLIPGIDPVFCYFIIFYACIQWQSDKALCKFVRIIVFFKFRTKYVTKIRISCKEQDI